MLWFDALWFISGMKFKIGMYSTWKFHSYKLIWGEVVRIAIYIHIYGEGNSTPLQYSCLENPMDGGAWWAAVYGAAQSDTTEAT